LTTAERLEQFAASPRARRFLAVLALGIWFETYDIFMVGYLGTVLVSTGFLSRDSLGPFVAAGFLGMFVGTVGFGAISDRVGRRPAFMWMLAAFSLFTLGGALAPSAGWLMVMRFLAGVGIGGEAIVIDTYVTELVPAGLRGRGVAFTQVVGFTSIPVVAFLARMLAWRQVMALGSIGAALVWMVRRRLPESPRWLESRGRFEEAQAALHDLDGMEGEATELAPPPPSVSAGELWRGTYLSRTLMLVVFNLLQTLGFYGFANWYPRYMMEQGVGLVDALRYSSIIALTAPLGAMVGLVSADRLERKWTLVGLSLAVASVGLMFAQARTAMAFIACGVALTIFNHWFSSIFHAWQCELYPTRLRTTGVGFTYGLSRLSAAGASWLTGWMLAAYGVTSVFALMAGAMVLVALDVALLSPPVNHRVLEEVSA
jgi:putative MFS transporter